MDLSTILMDKSETDPLKLSVIQNYYDLMMGSIFAIPIQLLPEVSGL